LSLAAVATAAAAAAVVVSGVLCVSYRVCEVHSDGETCVNAVNCMLNICSEGQYVEEAWVSGLFPSLLLMLSQQQRQLQVYATPLPATQFLFRWLCVCSLFCCCPFAVEVFSDAAASGAVRCQQNVANEVNH